MYFSTDRLFVLFNLYFVIFMLCRFIGSAKISLRDLANGQTKSLPSRNVPLVNEKKQDIGVIMPSAMYNTMHYTTAWLNY